jgi:rubrerythrin
MDGYESVIRLYYQDLESKIENEILTAVKSVGVVIDKDELLRALRYDRNQYEEGFKKGKLAMENSVAEWRSGIKNDIIDLISKIKYYHSTYGNELIVEDLEKILQKVNETIENAVEIEPVRYGYWIDNEEDKFICSICNGYVYHWFGRSEYCPRCGRKMSANGGTISKERFTEIVKGE